MSGNHFSGTYALLIFNPFNGHTHGCEFKGEGSLERAMAVAHSFENQKCSCRVIKGVQVYHSVSEETHESGS